MAHDVYSMLYIFSFKALEKLDLDILEFWLLIELSIFGVFFDLVFQICIASRTCIFSNFNHSLIKFFAVFFSMQFSICMRTWTHQGRPTSWRGIWGIISTLPDKNFVEELLYVIPQNSFPRNAFPQNAENHEKQ